MGARQCRTSGRTRQCWRNGLTEESNRRYCWIYLVQHSLAFTYFYFETIVIHYPYSYDCIRLPLAAVYLHITATVSLRQWLNNITTKKSILEPWRQARETSLITQKQSDAMWGKGFPSPLVRIAAPVTAHYGLHADRIGRAAFLCGRVYELPVGRPGQALLVLNAAYAASKLRAVRAAVQCVFCEYHSLYNFQWPSSA